jgi:hemoglobin-like flavoprotein
MNETQQENCQVNYSIEDVEESTTLKDVVVPDSSLKKMVISYVGQIVKPENDEVTVEMVISVLADEFPEIVMPLAEENWMRGYHQALADVDAGQKLYEQEQEKVQEAKKESE